MGANQHSRSSERYSPYPESIEDGPKMPTVDELEIVRQAALLYIKPTGSDDAASLASMAKVLAMTVQGRSEKDIAEVCGITRGQVRVARRALRERKLLGDALEHAVDRLKNEAVPAAVDATIAAIEGGDAKARDRVLDTFGLGPTKGASPAGDAPLVPQVPALTLNFNLPPGVTVERANRIPDSGKVIGRGKDQPRLEKRAEGDEPMVTTIDLPPSTTP